MKKNHQLHLLIHSMGKGEKRYFKVNNSKESSIYIKVFDLIIAQEEYDMEALKELLSDEKIASPLARVQHHLYQLLLKSLASFHATQHPRYEVMDAIKHYTILRDRGLEKQARKILRKALTQARANNYYGLVLEISDLMEDWITGEESYKDASKTKKELNLLNKENLSYTEEVLELKEQIFQLRLFFLKQQFARTDAQRQFLLGFIASTQERINSTDNFLLKRLLLTIEVYVYYGLQNYSKLVATEKHRLAVFNTNWQAAHISPFFVYAYHRNILWILLRNKNYKEHKKLVDNMEKNPVLIWLANASFYSVKLQIAKKITLLYSHVEQYHYHQAYHQIDDLWNLYLAHKKYWDMNLLVHSLVLFLNTTFCLGKYSETVQWLHILENNISQAYLLPYRNMGKIASLLIHDALGNQRFIQNALESTRIRLYRKNDFFEVANVFLKYFKQQIKDPSSEKQKLLLLKYKRQMEKIAQEEGQKGFFILFNFVDWFDSKLNNCCIAELDRAF